MKIVSFSKLTDKKKTQFFNWLAEQKNSDPAYENMWDQNWMTKPNTLPYILTNTDKYVGNNGDFHIAYDGSKIAGCAGVYKSSTNALIALAGSRTWIDTEYRNKLIAREFLLPAHKAWALKQKCKQIALCFNDYNKNLITIWKRRRLGENRSARESHHMFYSNFNQVEFPVIIQKTPQWVIYEQLDTSWDWNWKILAAPNK